VIKRLSKSALDLVGAVAFLVVGIVLAAVEPAQAQLIDSVKTDRSTYYRLKVKLAYKGEPQDFDIVVGCNVRQTFYKEGGNTYEAGLVPTVFGRRMSDGKGLVVRPPNACRGETTANRRVQPDLLPVVVVYDDADRLDDGVAYLSEDAYESPLAVLEFGGATIEAATRDDFERFRRTQANLVTREAYHSALSGAVVLKRLNLAAATHALAHICEGYERHQLDENMRNLVRPFWPESRPRYWATTYDAEGAVHRELIQNPARRTWTFNETAADLGLPTRTGGGLISAGRGDRFPHTYYPATSDYRLDRWPEDKQRWASYVTSLGRVADMHVDFRDGETRGFAYCYARALPGPELKDALSGKRSFARVGEEDVTAARAPEGPYAAPLWIMERDEFVFHSFRIYLESTRGEV
jgi:hypothetical protein